MSGSCVHDCLPEDKHIIGECFTQQTERHNLPRSLLETVGRKDRLLLAHGFNEFDGLLLTYACAFCSS